jgi:hypothetical protein
MIAKLHKARTTTANESLVSETFSGRAPMIAEHADGPLLRPTDSSARRLRNRIILANAIVWIAIIALVHMIFF